MRESESSGLARGFSPFVSSSAGRQGVEGRSNPSQVRPPGPIRFHGQSRSGQEEGSAGRVWVARAGGALWGECPWARGAGDSGRPRLGLELVSHSPRQSQDSIYPGALAFTRKESESLNKSCGGLQRTGRLSPHACCCPHAPRL